MRCLIEIATIEVGDVSNYSILLNMFIQCLMSFLPVETGNENAMDNERLSGRSWEEAKERGEERKRLENVTG